MQLMSVRQARTFLAVAERGSVTGAAGDLNKTQTSVTKTVHEIEQVLGVELFQRSSRGVRLSVYGDALLPLAVAARQEFKRAESYVPPAVVQNTPGAARFFRMDVSEKWLDAWVVAAEMRSVAAAAQHLKITSAAVSASLRKLEDSIGLSLFERSATGLHTTSVCRALIRHIKLARNYLRQIGDAIARVTGLVRGRVVIGTLPFVRTVILPQAILRVLKHHPELDIATTEAPYDDLVTGLRCGDIDFLLGAMRGEGADQDIAEEPLLADDLSMIVRAEHPLLKQPELTWRDLLTYPWVLPRLGTPTRSLLQQVLQQHGLAEPKHVVETTSFVTLRGVIMDSDYITILSGHQIEREKAAGMLAVLDIAMPETSRLLGVSTRAQGALSPAAEAVVSEVREVVREL